MSSTQYNNWFLNLHETDVQLYREWAQMYKPLSEQQILNANINFNLNKQEELIATLKIENSSILAIIQDKIQIFPEKLRHTDKLELQKYCQFNIQKQLLKEMSAQENIQEENQLYSNKILQENTTSLLNQQQEEFKQSEFQIKKENSSKNLEVIFKQKNCIISIKSEVTTLKNPLGYSENLQFKEFINKNNQDPTALVNDFEVYFQNNLIKINYSYQIIQCDKNMQYQSFLMEKSPSVKEVRESSAHKKMKSTAKKGPNAFKLQPLMSSSSENQFNLQENQVISPVMVCTDFLGNTANKEQQQQRKFTEDIMISQEINNNQQQQQQQQDQKIMQVLPTGISQFNNNFTQETASTQKHQKQQQQQIIDSEDISNINKISLVKQFNQKNKKLQFVINTKEEKKQNLTEATQNEEMSQSLQQFQQESQEKEILRTPIAHHSKKTGHSNAGSSSKKPDKKNVVKNFVKAFRVYLKKLKETKKSEDQFPVQNYEELSQLVDDFENFEQSRNYNNGLIIEITSSKKYRDVWGYFLQYHAGEWLRTSGVQDKEAHREVLKQYIKSLENPQELHKITVLRKGYRKQSQV